MVIPAPLPLPSCLFPQVNTHPPLLTPSCPHSTPPLVLIPLDATGSLQPSAHPTAETALTVNTTAVLDATATNGNTVQPTSEPSLSVPFVQSGTGQPTTTTTTAGTTQPTTATTAATTSMPTSHTTTATSSLPTSHTTTATSSLPTSHATLAASGINVNQPSSLPTTGMTYIYPPFTVNICPSSQNIHLPSYTSFFPHPSPFFFFHLILL